MKTGNICKLIYYVILNVYVSKPSSNYFDSTSLTQLLLAYQLNVFWTTITISISHFLQAGKKDKRKTQRPSARSGTQPFHPHKIVSPTQLPLIPLQCNIHCDPFHYVLPHASGGTFPLHCVKCFLCSLTLFFLCYCYDTGRMMMLPKLSLV